MIPYDSIFNLAYEMNFHMSIWFSIYDKVISDS
jgi:hypothetical protein